MCLCLVHITSRHRLHKQIFLIFLLVRSVASPLILSSRFFLLISEVFHLFRNHRMFTSLAKYAGSLSLLLVLLEDLCPTKPNVLLDLFSPNQIEVLHVRGILNPTIRQLRLVQLVLLPACHDLSRKIIMLLSDLYLLYHSLLVDLQLFQSIGHHHFLIRIS